MDIKLTERQCEILKIIVELYATTVIPISSSNIIEHKLKNISSATVRNDMNVLEKYKLIEKTHTSSGRIPSINGYKYYQQHILRPSINEDIKMRLTKIFNNRELSIDTIIDQSVSIINENLKLPMVVVSQTDETLKRFDLVKISNHEALVVLITSSGTIHKNNIIIKDENQFNDIAICVRVFNDRLVDTSISEINSKIDSIKEIIRKIVHEYEFCLQKIITKIFDLNLINKKTNVVGTKHLLAQPEFHDLKRLNEVLGFLEDTNIWKHISLNYEKSGNTSFTFGDAFNKKNLAIASTSINTENTKHQIAIVGPTRMSYDKVNGILEFIKTEIEKHKNRI